MRETHLVRHSRELTDAVQGVIARGAETVVVGGGDGTLSAVIDFFANKTDLCLGLLPLGTGNEVARVLGIPQNLVGACAVVSHGRVTAVDLGQVNGDFFIHTALIGYPAHINHTIPSWLKLAFGKTAYIYSLLGSALGLKPFFARVVAGKQSWEGETVLLVVANGRFHGPHSALLPRSEVAETGLLVYTPRDTRPTTLLRLVFGLWVTRQRLPSLLSCITGDSAIVVADPPQEIDVDGEFTQLTPAVFQLAREAVRILVPNSVGDDLR